MSQMKLLLKNTEADERPPSRPIKPFQRKPLSDLFSQKGNTSGEAKKVPIAVVRPTVRLDLKPKKYILYGRLTTLPELVASAVIKRWAGIKCAFDCGRGWTVPDDERILFERLYHEILVAGMQALPQETYARPVNERPTVANNEESVQPGPIRYVVHRQPSNYDSGETSAPILPVRTVRRSQPLKNPWEYIVNGQRTTGAELVICGMIYNWNMLKRVLLNVWRLGEPLERITFDLSEMHMLQALIDMARRYPRYANVETPGQDYPLQDTLMQFCMPSPKLETTVRMHVNMLGMMRR